MIVINTTFHAQLTIAPDVKKWLAEVYIPGSLKHEHLSSARLARVLGGDDPDGISYAVQFECPTLAAAKHWHDHEGADLRAQMLRRWGQRTLFFTTYLQVL